MLTAQNMFILCQRFVPIKAALYYIYMFSQNMYTPHEASCCYMVFSDAEKLFMHIR